MKKILMCVLFAVLLFSNAFGQTYDKKYVEKTYVSYFSTNLKNPVVVSYKMYMTGGKGEKDTPTNCDRTGKKFKGDKYTATYKDYKGTIDSVTKQAKYDIGHMDASFTRAYNCELQDATFRFYNSTPQLVSLNRGAWRHYENMLVDMSQSDSLLVICYNVFSNKKLNNSNVYIPDYCIKIVKSLSKNKILFALKFNNMEKTDKPISSTYQMLKAEYDFTLIDIILNKNIIDVE